MESELARLGSYLTCKDVPSWLSRRGFYYSGHDKAVICHLCNLEIGDWTTVKDIFVFHRQRKPTCVGAVDPATILSTGKPKDKQREVVKSAAAVGPGRPFDVTRVLKKIRHPNFVDLNVRIASFTGSQSKVGEGQTAKELAEAGLFWVGPGDNVRCFVCDGGLMNWKPKDVPLAEHKTHFSECEFCKRTLEPREIKARMDSSIVQQILEMGYNRELLRTVIRDHYFETMNDFESSNALLEAFFQREDDILTGPSQQAAAAPKTTQQAAAAPKTTQQAAAAPKTKQQAAAAPKTRQQAAAAPKTRQQAAAAPKTTTQEGPLYLTEKSEADVIAEAKALVEANRELSEARTCKVCMDRTVDVVFLPCGHLCCCSNCSPELRNCPICRGLIRGNVKIFLS